MGSLVPSNRCCFFAFSCDVSQKTSGGVYRGNKISTSMGTRASHPPSFGIYSPYNIVDWGF